MCALALHPTPFWLKVPYVPRLFACHFQVFRFRPFQTIASTVSGVMGQTFPTAEFDPT